MWERKKQENKKNIYFSILLFHYMQQDSPIRKLQNKHLMVLVVRKKNGKNARYWNKSPPEVVGLAKDTKFKMQWNFSKLLQQHQISSNSGINDSYGTGGMGKVELE